MWSLIRKKQGIPENISAYDQQTPEDRYMRHQRIILLHETRPFTPFIDPKVYTRAYGELNYDKVTRWLLESDSNMRLQAIEHLIELYTEKQEHCVKSLKYDVLRLLIAVMKNDPEEQMRSLSASALAMLLKEPATQNSLDREDWKFHLRDIMTATRDECDGVVVLSLRALGSCHGYHNHFMLTEILIELECMELLVGLIKSSSNPMVKAVACSVLSKMLDIEKAFSRFAELDGIHVLSDVLRSADANDTALLAGAAEVISRSCECAFSRQVATSCGTMNVLWPHLSNPDLMVRVAVAAALAQITILEDAKIAASDAPPFLEAIIKAVGQEVERDVLVYLSRLIYHISECPKGRVTLRVCRNDLEKLHNFTCESEESETTRQTFSNTIDILYRK